MLLAHGEHLAGHNKTMAQWTADRWAEFGLTSRLDQYCRSMSKHLQREKALTQP